MVPDGWTKITLNELLSASVKNGYSANSVECETGYVVLGLGALTDDKLNLKEVKNVEPTHAVKNTQLASGDFLISRSNTPDKVGRSALFRGEIKNCSYPDLMMRFTIDKKIAHPEFIEALLQSSNVRQYFKSCASGSSKSMVKITKSVVEKTPIELPPLSEQRKIAEIFIKWNQAIKVTEKLIVNNKAQKQALMQQLLTGKRRLLDEEGNEFKEDWNEAALVDICLITKGKQLNRSTLSAEGKYPVINGGTLPSGYTESYNANGNTITISEGGNSCGYVDFQNSKFWCGGHCYNVTQPEINTCYLYQFLKYNERRIMALRVGSGLPNIQKKEIENFKVQFPNDIEQEKIALVLAKKDKEVELLKQQLVGLKQEKKALMQQLLTGKRRVKVDSSEVLK